MKGKSIALLLLSVPAFSQTPRHQQQAPQHLLRFSAEDAPSAKAVAIPQNVWRVLKEDQNVQTVLMNDDPPLSEPPRSWFAGFPVKLRGEAASDLVVQGEDRLLGANVTTFWVFLQTPSGPKLVLTLPAHDLTIMPTRWHGYRKIAAAAATAVRAWSTTFCFDGSRYAPCGEN
jgi:hypothetical protein